jgi:hypothetical protein
MFSNTYEWRHQMKRFNRWIFILLVLVGLQLSACAPKSATAEKINPAKVEPIDGSDLKRVTLTEKAAERIDVQTAAVQGKVVPYAAVIYDTEGNTWVYTNPEPLVFVRQSIVIDRIEGEQAILFQGLSSDTMVVTVGVAELYGAETGVSK